MLAGLPLSPVSADRVERCGGEGGDGWFVIGGLALTNQLIYELEGIEHVVFIACCGQA